MQRPGEKHTRCRLCGDRLSGCRFSAARLEVEAGVQRNSLIVELFSTDVGGEGRQVSGWGQLDWDILSSPALHHVNRRRGFTRELTEALAMLAALRRVMAAHRRQGEQEGGVEEPWHVVDLCCGKGFLATLVAVSFPSFAVTAIDRRSGAFLPHFEAAGITNIRYAQLDVMSPGFPDEVSRLVEAAGRRRPVAVLGMHLCGLLSVRAAELLWEVPGVEAVVLAPCCLPNARYAEDTPPAVYQGADQQEKFTRWCDFLETRISSGGEGVQRAKGSPVPVTCTREVVEAIVSDKRTVLTASRVRLSTQRDEAAAPLRDFL